MALGNRLEDADVLADKIHGEVDVSTAVQDDLTLGLMNERIA